MSGGSAARVPLRRKGGEVRAWTVLDLQSPYVVCRWHLNNGYAARTVLVEGRKRCVFLHREVLGLVPGDGLEADHINGDKLDNRRSNLRVVTRAQNAQNMRRSPGRYSRHRGVTWDHRRQAWQASAHTDGRPWFLGNFKSETDAAGAAKAFRMARMPFAEE